MVLINGVKYACERCIRGHRVTTCTHTDQQLTMIKPKGRPASQCQHCREHRKHKHSHVSCTCGKKGKSPGMHLASCLCHKNSHCTCSSTSSKKIAAAADKSKKKNQSKVNLANGQISPSKQEANSLNHDQASSAPSQQNGTTANGIVKDDAFANSTSNYVIEDVVVPFEPGHGLFDLFSSNVSENNSNSNLNLNLGNVALSPSSSVMTNSNTENTSNINLNSSSASITNNNNPNNTNTSNNTNNPFYKDEIARNQRPLSQLGSRSNSNANFSKHQNLQFYDNDNDNNDFNRHHQDENPIDSNIAPDSSNNFNDNTSNHSDNNNGHPIRSPPLQNQNFLQGSRQQQQQQQQQQDPQYTTSDSEDVDMVENMFPLFPLVGSCSFDDSKSLPMSSMATPNSASHNLGSTASASNSTHHPRPVKALTSPLHQSHQAYQESAPPSQHHQAPHHSHHQQQHFHPQTHQPHPTTNVSNNHHNIRPKRPESVLSTASNSSGKSANIEPGPHIFNHSFNLPTQSSNSSAFPPFDLAEESDEQQLPMPPSASEPLDEDRSSAEGINNSHDFSSSMAHHTQAAPPQLKSQSSQQQLQHMAHRQDPVSRSRQGFDDYFNPFELKLESYEDFINDMKGMNNVIDSSPSVTAQSSSLPSRQPSQNGYQRNGSSNLKNNAKNQNLNNLGDGVNESFKSFGPFSPLQQDLRNDVAQNPGLPQEQNDSQTPQIYNNAQDEHAPQQSNSPQPQQSPSQQSPAYLNAFYSQNLADIPTPMFNDIMYPVRFDEKDN